MPQPRPLAAAALAAALAAAPIRPAAAQDAIAVPPPAVERFDRFVGRAAPLCETAPAARCVDAAWTFGDADGDGRLAPDEARRLRDALLGWAQWPDNRAAGDERAFIFLGLSMVDTVGLERLMAGFDADGDGALTRAELLADLRLDERPLGAVLADPRALDRAALGRRLGALAPALGALLERENR